MLYLKYGTLKSQYKNMTLYLYLFSLLFTRFETASILDKSKYQYIVSITFDQGERLEIINFFFFYEDIEFFQVYFYM